jgi:hypothetical protein
MLAGGYISAMKQRQQIRDAARDGHFNRIFVFPFGGADGGSRTRL